MFVLVFHQWLNSPLLLMLRMRNRAAHFFVWNSDGEGVLYIQESFEKFYVFCRYTDIIYITDT